MTEAGRLAAVKRGKMSDGQRIERDLRILHGWFEGKRRAELAGEFGLSLSQISVIVGRESATEYVCDERGCFVPQSHLSE